MTKTLVLSQGVKGSWKATGDNGLQATKNFGDTDEPAGAVNFATGIDVNQCNVMYRRAASIAPAATFSVDLKGGGGEVDVLNNALSMAKVRYIRLIIVTPTTLLVLRLGPQNVTNGFLGPWSVATANGYSVVANKFEQDSPIDGWTVDSTHKVLSINNPSASAIAYVLEVMGTDA